MTHPPILYRPKKEEILYAYVAVTTHAISLVLVRTEEGVQKPVYYVNKSLQEAETRYLPLEKAILAIIHATKKLPNYFQAHMIVILTQLPFQALLQKSNFTGRVAKWGTILEAFNIKYLPWATITGKVLAYLVAEFTKGAKNGDSEEYGMLDKGVMAISASPLPQWKLYMDGAANQRGLGIGIVLISPEHITIEKSLRLDLLATNSKVEYEALMTSLDFVKKLEGEIHSSLL